MIIERIKLAALALALVVMAGNAVAGDGERLVENFLKDLKTLKADFNQSLVDAEKNILEESVGILMLSRPGRFSLEYSSPNQQLYVADGQRIWMYDRDLEQVTVKPQPESLGSTPAMILSGTTPLKENFELRELGRHEGFVWIELKPKSEESGFEFMRLAMEGRVLRAMEMIDSFGQTTRLFFNKIVRNPTLPEKSFSFTPPPGVDVIGESQGLE